MDNLNNMTIGVVKTEQWCSKHVLLVCVGKRAASLCMDLISYQILGNRKTETDAGSLVKSHKGSGYLVAESSSSDTILLATEDGLHGIVQSLFFVGCILLKRADAIIFPDDFSTT